MKLQLDRISTIGVFLTAMASPCCFPLFGFLLAAFGLGSFELFGGWTMWVFQGFVALSVAGAVISFLQYKRILPLAATVLGAGLIFYAYHVSQSDDWTYLLYAGMFLLLGAALLNFYGSRQRRRQEVVLRSVLTCPSCGHRKEEVMPEDACRYFYECTSCRTRLKPKPGDCCVYCSYGTVKCPPVQRGQACCPAV